MTDHWKKIQSRLETVRSTLEKGFKPGAEKKAEILKSRAKALAQKRGRNEKYEASLQVVEFLLAHEKYCIELLHIREVYPLKEVTPLPCTPPYVLGIINFRGQILSIVDLKKFFNLPDQELTDHHQVIILSSDEMEFGILANEILGVRSVPLSEIQPTLSTLTGIGIEYLKGVTKGRTVVLDGGKILSDKNIVVHQDV